MSKGVAYVKEYNRVKRKTYKSKARQRSGYVAGYRSKQLATADEPWATNSKAKRINRQIKARKMDKKNRAGNVLDDLLNYAVLLP